MIRVNGLSVWRANFFLIKKTKSDTKSDFLYLNKFSTKLTIFGLKPCWAFVIAIV
ncbi:hypothetical protein [Moraxella lacunata]|uniref:hypothetical protein n=1 Tax=Moraxella lacunata TaxID=477 RepID=UPI003EE21C87